MAKKTFKDNNPALAFISNTEEVAEQKEEKVVVKTTKKSPEGYKRNPEYIETKSRRVQLVLQPTVVDALKELAKEKGLSMNETANEAILAYLEKEGKVTLE